MGYPVAAYRNVRPPKGPPSSSGRRNRREVAIKNPRRPKEYSRGPQPAKDNWRPFPKPKPPTPPFGRKVPPGVAAIARRSPGIARFVMRGIPVFGTALRIYDLLPPSRAVGAGHLCLFHLGSGARLWPDRLRPHRPIHHLFSHHRVPYGAER